MRGGSSGKGCWRSVLVGCAVLLLVTVLPACAPVPASSGEPVQRVLLAAKEGTIDPLMGQSIPAAELGVAANGCVTLGSAYLRAGYGSALSEDGDEAALDSVGVYRLGETVPEVYGYRRSFTEGTLPVDRRRCGPGEYVDVVSSNSLSRAGRLLTGTLSDGEATRLNGILNAAGNGCVRVGGDYLIAPEGSRVIRGGTAVSIQNAGEFVIGAGMPELPADRSWYPASEVPPALSGCGPGSYVATTGLQDGPVLTYDAVDDSARMLVGPPSTETAPETGVVRGVLGRRSTCTTVGDDFLVAPHGSGVFDGGRRIRLQGIGTFTIGEELRELPARSITYRERSLPEAILDCGAGTYTEVWPPRN